MHPKNHQQAFHKEVGSETDLFELSTKAQQLFLLAYIQQVFWAKKYLQRKSEGFSDSILNSNFLIEN
jgi:hypothetical protein